MIRRVRSLVQRNLPAKLLAVFAAVILWGYVMNDQNPAIEGSFEVPLTVINAPEGYQVTQDEETVKIRVRGPRSLFVSAQASDFEAYVDLEKASQGTHDFHIHTYLPQGFELVSVKPETAQFTLDRIEEKEMRVDIIVSGAPAQGATVARVEPRERTVTVEGPRTLLAEVDRVIGYVGLSGNSEDFSLNVPLTAINADGREVAGVTIMPGSVEASVQLARGLAKKVVSIRAATTGGLSKELELVSLKLDPQKIEVAGTVEDLAQLETVETEPIALNSIKESGKLTARLRLPSGIVATNADVSVNIEVKGKADSGKN